MQTNPSSVNKNEQSLNVLDLLMYLTSKWKWFLFSVLICGGIAWYQYASSPKVYFGKTTVIIKDPSNKTSTAGLDRYDNFINKVNVANEILQFRSKKLMREVVQRVHADISYQKKSGLHYDELYTQSPVNVSFPDALPEQYLGFTVTIQDSTTVLLSDFIREEEKSEYQVRLNDTLSLRSGSLVITPTNFFSKAWTNVPIKVRKQPLDGVAARYQGNLGIRQEEDESSILTLSLKDNSPKRAEDILNTLINVYNEEAIKDKNQVAINTANFINDRLIIISQELGDVESDLESFKRDNQVVDIASSASMYMSESQKYNADALELETQLRLARYIKEYLTDPKKETDLIPANTGISDMNIETQITAYNATKLKRDRLISDSSDKNPVVEELNNTLHAMKQSIIRAVDNMIVSINVKRIAVGSAFCSLRLVKQLKKKKLNMSRLRTHELRSSAKLKNPESVSSSIPLRSPGTSSTSLQFESKCTSNNLDGMLLVNNPSLCVPSQRWLPCLIDISVTTVYMARALSSRPFLGISQ